MNLTAQSDLSPESAGHPEFVPLLNSRELLALGEIWKNQKKILTARFGGASMLPTITPVDAVVFDCGRHDPSVGDVIARVYADRLLLHRVVAAARDGRWLLTRGDANVRPDPPLFDRSELIGTVVKVRRDGRDCPVLPASPSVLARSMEACCRFAALFGDRVLVIAVVAVWSPYGALRICMNRFFRVSDKS